MATRKKKKKKKKKKDIFQRARARNKKQRRTNLVGKMKVLEKMRNASGHQTENERQ